MTDRQNKTLLLSTKKIKLSSFSDCHDSKRLIIAASKDDGKGAPGSVNHVLSSPNLSRSPEGSVFSIDHILESILGKCDQQTLVNSRLVSRRWAFYGSKELQKIVSILFYKLPHSPGDPRRFQFLADGKHSLEDLITVMNNSSEFPCTSFDFRNEIEGKTRQSPAQSFFDAHGAAIKKMKFQYLCIDELKTFLLSQAPNLQQLHLGGTVEVNYTHSTEGPNSLSETGEQQSKRKRCQESLFDAVFLKPKPILKNLKKFKCHYSAQVPEILIRQILECSPNLFDVALPSDYLHLLVHPTNRVQLVKQLTIDINSSNIESYELFANHLQDNEDFAVCKLYHRTSENYADDRDEEFYARVTNVMRKLLGASSATCQKLVWGEDVNNLQMPRMPQVKHLTIQYALDVDADDDKETMVPVHSLRDRVSLGDTFPKLKSLELRTRTVMGIHPIPNIFSDVDPLPAANVKTVTMRLYRPCQKVVQSFKKMFPNAAFRKKVPAYSDDDGDSDQGSGKDETDSDEAGNLEENDDGENKDDGEALVALRLLLECHSIH